MLAEFSTLHCLLDSDSSLDSSLAQGILTPALAIELNI